MKRRRLAALTAATVASFKARRTQAALGPPSEGGADHTSNGGGALEFQRNEAVDCGSDTDRTNGSGGSSRSYGDLGREDGEEAEQGNGEPGSGSSSGSSSSRVEALPRAERRDTLTLVSGMEVGGLGVGVDAAAATTSGENRSKLTLARNHEGAADRQPAVQQDRRDRARRWPEDESERIWRASWHGKKRERKGETANGKDGVHAGTVAAAQRRAGEGSSPPLSGMASPSAVVADHGTAPATADVGIEGASTAQAAATSASLANADGIGAPAPACSPRPDKLPTEFLASMLLSEHEFVGGKMSAADVVDRARQWEQQQQQRHHHDQQGQQQSQRQVIKMLPFPDLPYGFTDLGRRVNVEQPHRRGIELEPTQGLAETR